MKPLIQKFALLLGTLALVFAIGEVTVRAMGSIDTAGNFVFKQRIIRPHSLPLDVVEKSVARLNDSDNSIIMYDQYLGWTPRPEARSENGLYQFNSQAIRSNVASYSARPDSGVLRIALFGDSFTHCDDVSLEESFGYYLEEGLKAAGMRAEVLNFGVGGYGIDQAMLRFVTQGKAFAPHLVVMGFQPENLKRNLNLLRPLYDPRTRLPFAKPRFVAEGDGISLINVPVLPPSQVAATLADLANWELLPHEYYYDPDDYRGAWWQRSKMLATLVDLKLNREDRWVLKRVLYRDQSEAQKLGLLVIQAFAQEVTATGAEFKIVHLPTPTEMNVWRRLGRWPYQNLLDTLDKTHAVVHPEVELLKAVEADGLDAIYAGHFTARGNRIIADILQQSVVGMAHPAP